MSEVEVSSERRVVFTAVALVLFWVLTWQAYSIATADAYTDPLGQQIFFVMGVGIHSHPPRWHLNHSAYSAASMALVPLLFLLIARSNSLLALRNPWIAASAALFVVSIVLAGLLGQHDALALIEAGDLYAVSRETPQVTVDGSTNFPVVTSIPRYNTILVEMQGRHAVSWLLLVLPIIATTAFVCYDARRSAGRAANAVVPGD